MDRAQWAALPESARKALQDFLEAELQGSRQRLVHEESPEAILRRQGEAQFLSRKQLELKKLDDASRSEEPEDGRQRNTGY